MAGPGITEIVIRRGLAVFHVYGPDAGAEGVWLAQGQVDGLYDASVKTTWRSGAFQVGSTQKSVKYEHRDLDLGFHLIETAASTFEWNESEFRQIFNYEDDPWEDPVVPTVIEVTTEISGTRKLDVLMHEKPTMEAAVDPLKQQHCNIILHLRAAQPLWYEADRTSTFTSTATAASSTVLVENPTDQPMLHRWIVTSAAGGGDVNYTLPDFEWSGAPGARAPGGTNAARLINDIVVTAAHDGATIELDRSKLMYRAADDSNILGSMGGSKLFTYAIPSWTAPFYLPVSYKGATGGATVQLVMPRKWSRPWGLEASSVLDTSSPQDNTWRVNDAGSFSFQIPEWCERMDITVIGGGGGGEGGDIVVSGSGADPAVFQAATIIRGVDIPWATRYLAGEVGRGGYGGRGADLLPFQWDDWWGGTDGTDGVATYVVADGMTTMSSAGGTGGKAQLRLHGLGAAGLTFNDVTFEGSDNAEFAGGIGNFPGGGGAGGWPLVGKAGGGGGGQVIIRAYGWAGS